MTDTRFTHHIRQPLPRRRGNSFYRDKRDLSAHVKTFCGAPVTDRDLDLRWAGTKKTQKWFRDNHHTATLCPGCQDAAGLVTISGPDDPGPSIFEGGQR